MLHVVEPHLNGPGGDMTGLFATADDPRPRSWWAGPGAGRRDHRALPRRGLDLVPGAGALAAAVPGAVDAWLMLLRDHGTWELGEVLAFAIEYAAEGHPVSPRAVVDDRTVADLFSEHWPTSAALWMPGGGFPRAGELIRTSRTPRRCDGWSPPVTAHRHPGGPHRRARRAWGDGFVAEAIEDVRADPAPALRRLRPRRRHHRADMAAFSAGYEDRPPPGLPRRHRRQDRAVGSGAGAARRRWPC